jgi:phosphatidylserine decarboxylase
MRIVFASLFLLIAAFAWWRFYFFHRNPSRVPPSGTTPVCPADGRILYVEDVMLREATPNLYHQRVHEAFGAQGTWTVVATYLSIFDVHFVRAPIAGRVRLHHMSPIDENLSMGGSFFTAALRRPLPLGQRAYMEKNEFLGLSIEGDIHVLLVLMADWWIDQIYALVDDGEVVTRGQLLGKIQMGSQVDVWIPTTLASSLPRVGDRVRAGETLLTQSIAARSLHAL